MIADPSTPEQNASSAPPASPASVEPVAAPDVQAPRQREPIMMIVKSICDRVDEMKPISEFLGS